MECALRMTTARRDILLQDRCLALPTFNKTQYRSERMILRIREKIVQQIEDQVKVYPLESLYPSIEDEVDGRFVMKQEILPHQSLVHRKLTPSGNRPKYI